MELLNEKQASDLLKLSRGFLRSSRSKNPTVEGPPYLKFGRAVRYDPEDLLAWRDRHRVTPQSPADQQTA